MKAPGFITGGRRPPLWREARIGLEAAALLRDPILRGEGVADGRGRPVLLIPGFMAGDGSLALMAGWLSAPATGRAGRACAPTSTARAPLVDAARGAARGARRASRAGAP